MRNKSAPSPAGLRACATRTLRAGLRARGSRTVTLVCATALILAFHAAEWIGAAAQTTITSPQQQFGFEIGADYRLANYKQLADYWRKLDAESDRMTVQEIGKTSEGRPHLMSIVTSPENHRNLARYKQISQRLGFAEGLSDADARALAKEGKAIVWIDGGLHANETLGAQQLIQIVYEMVSRTDEETIRFLNDTIILFVHANPDGHDLVADWYMRNPVPEQRSSAGLPRLYHQYIGHDNNRDFFASTQKETENINRILYHEWMPQILYNHHQSGPAGTVAWSSPQRDPYNYNLDPLLILGLQALGTHMHQRMASEGKPGLTMASGGPYDGWWNGGIRNTGNFHNIIAILTETIGNPAPMRIPFRPERQLPNRDYPYPIAPQEWKFKQSIDYSMSFNRAVIDYAARNREHLLFNIFKMGQRAITRGSEDTWTPAPSRVNALTANDPEAWATLRKPELRDPRGYIIPADQADFPTAIKFINALREVNVTVHRARAAFDVGGKKYAAGSFVVMTAQAFRPHVIDMFEPQDHPNVIPYPGAPPTPPYDNAGWTLAFQMGVQFDRVLEPFSGPFEKVTEWNVKPAATDAPSASGGIVLDLRQNDSYLAINRFQKTGKRRVAAQGPTFGGQRVIVDGSGSVPDDLRSFGLTLGRSGIVGGGTTLRAPRIGLWDQYGGSMPSGWTRWILEQFEFPFSRVFAPELDAGNLNAKYDALIFVNGAIPGVAGAGGGGRGGGRGGASTSATAGRPAQAQPEIPAEYRSHVGRMTAEATIPKLRAFVDAGGTLIAIGSSAENIVRHLNLPLDDHLVEDGKPLPRAKYFVPGSVLTAAVDTRHPAAAGMAERAHFFFDNSPVFKVRGADPSVRVIARFDTATPLKSGWAWGQTYLEGGVVAADVQVGKGRVYLYGPEILHRAQPHGTFKLLFNALLASGGGQAR
ncbi:MAG: M14 family metallopeptidase [Acidobacteriota bacterium]|nr:M14 family metallopeptidase [Acidobacteriota bacterium]